MKLLGIIGGIGPESTVDFYRLFVAVYQERKPDGSYPPLLINCIDVTKMLNLVATDLAGLQAYLLAEIHRLAQAGATTGLLSANTPHIVFDELRQASPVPLLSMVEATCERVAAQGLKRVALFGTRFTMAGGFYQKVFTRTGIDLVIPEADDLAYIHQCYMNELLKGVFRPAARERMVDIARQLQAQQGVEAVIMGGTELPLLLREAGDIGLPLLDTTRLLVERAVSEFLA